MPTASERLIWGFGDGSTMPVFDTSIGRIGAAICWENYMPMLRMHMYNQGVQLYCAPTADDRDSWQATVRHIALEGRCFVLSSNQFARRSDYPDEYPAAQGSDPQTIMSRGGSCIIDPLGRILAGPLYDNSGVLTADLDLDEIVRGKFDFDVVGHYARPDVFRLLVNTADCAMVVAETCEGAPDTSDGKSGPADDSELSQGDPRCLIDPLYLLLAGAVVLGLADHDASSDPSSGVAPAAATDAVR